MQHILLLFVIFILSFQINYTILQCDIQFYNNELKDVGFLQFFYSYKDIEEGIFGLL